MMEVRPESRADHGAVREVLERAFGCPSEAELVEALRRSANPQVSVVAETAGRVVGHIFFSPVVVGDPDSGASSESRPQITMGLAPMAVTPEVQKQGVGAALVREGLRACRDLGSGAVVVLGYPEYYPRFGFRPAERFGLGCEYEVPAEVFMALELSPGALESASGLVRYHPAFAEVE